jgi:hypothetical protein
MTEYGWRNNMIPVPRILDYVVEILKASSRPFRATDICDQLALKGVNIERTMLTQILWNQNDRSELVVDKTTFKWRYDTDAAKHVEEATKRKEEIRKEVVKNAALLEFWEDIGFDFVGVGRKGTVRPFFFLREEAGHYLLIGPTGNLLREKSQLCSNPVPLLPGEFTVEQVKRAAEELLNERRQRIIAETHEIITLLRNTELLVDEVYLGPAMIRVEDSIPVSGIIFVANVSRLEPCTFSIGWGTVLAPLYLVINTLGFGIRSDSRYGVFKICVYELIKRDLLLESEDSLTMTVILENDRICIGSEKNNLYLV